MDRILVSADSAEVARHSTMMSPGVAMMSPGVRCLAGG